MNRMGVIAAFLVCTVVAVAASGCGSASPSATISSPAASGASQASADTWRTRSELQTQLLRSFIYSAQSWSAEPRGDVRPSSGVSSTLVFAKVIALPDHARRVRFDCYQLYVGNAAKRAAREDGVDPATMNSPTYVRNSFAHVQELPVSTTCPVVTTGNGEHVQDGFGRAAGARLFYWLVIGADGKVHGGLWQATY